MSDDIEKIIERAITRLPPQLLKYWTAGAGAAKIGWGVPGDFNRCRVEIQQEVSEKGAPLSPHIIDGLCATLHKIATGATPGHAPGEQGGHHGHRSTERAGMANKAPYGNVTYADPGYQKDGVKRYPIDTKEHAKAAWSYINQSDNAAIYSSENLAAIKGRIKSALAKFGVKVSDSGRMEEMGQMGTMIVPDPAQLFATLSFTRSYPLEDISIRAGGDGRTVEAYAAVFNSPTTIVDQDGHYQEELDTTVFNRAISHAAPQGGRTGWKVGVFYNHGMTMMGTPSDRHSMPVGVPIEIRVEPKGLLTVTRYNKTSLADEIIENIHEGGITGYSFSGMFKRSTPIKPRGGYRMDSAGNLPLVRRLESTLREYGPTPFPAYQEASIVGMRAAQFLSAVYTQDEVLSILNRSDAQDDQSGQPSAADYAALAAGDSPASTEAEHSGRSVKEQMIAARSKFLQSHGRKGDQ